LFGSTWTPISDRKKERVSRIERNKRICPGEGADAPFEHELIGHGLKWWPIKCYEGRFPRGKGASSNWRLAVESIVRAEDVFPTIGVPHGIYGSCYSYAMPTDPKRPKKLRPTWKAVVEVAFIVFLFYSNLLMGEFTRANGHGKSLTFAVEDIISVTNLVIAVVSGLLGYVVFEYLRKHL
jgi:hypothetical protein